MKQLDLLVQRIILLKVQQRHLIQLQLQLQLLIPQLITTQQNLGTILIEQIIHTKEKI